MPESPVGAMVIGPTALLFEFHRSSVPPSSFFRSMVALPPLSPSMEELQRMSTFISKKLGLGAAKGQ
jgi:hypothetical protein